MSRNHEGRPSIPRQEIMRQFDGVAGPTGWQLVNVMGFGVAADLSPNERFGQPSMSISAWDRFAIFS